ncbi:MAG TPA: DUF3566 domain-containing protein [Gemmatimonadaceae bacterium]|jgi:hypothetical protein|nr:DUF3566 domain-containing protein [Gemmatimonadaceae bacterium]
MRRQIIRLSVRQTSKVLAVLYGAMGLVLVPLFLLASLAGPEGERIGVGFALVLPILYAALGYVFTAIGCAIYNVVARHVGGIEVELQPPEELAL